jgi:homoserine O-acetyltransferase/O-succinyltransferase
MKSGIRAWVIVIIVFFAAGITRGQGILQYADLGDFRLENGRVIQDCRVGYRTFGELNPEKSNAVLFPTWFGGTTQDLMPFIGPGKLVDTARYFVIAVDALGNGVSSSPSNGRAQPGPAFPRFSIRDMVDSQHALLTRTLRLNRLHAVIGISMGGMQTFQWMVSYPDFLEKALPIVGTPRLTAYDKLLWQTELRVIDALGRSERGDTLAMRIVADIHALAIQTPHYLATHTAPEEFPRFLKANEDGLSGRSAQDWASQLNAMMAHDIYAPFGGSVVKAAKSVHAKVLMIVSKQDLMVNPEPARELAGPLNAELTELTGDCGHLAPSCEEETVRAAVSQFLRK